LHASSGNQRGRDLARSKIGGNAVDLPVPVANGIELAAAAGFRRPWRGRPVALGAACRGLGSARSAPGDTGFFDGAAADAGFGFTSTIS
jgi:hypothetical protein